MAVPEVVVLGGAGHMGGRVVNELAESGEVRVRIADFNLEKAREMASRYGERAAARFVDANQRESLLSALQGAVAVVNCVGPFYRYAAKIAAVAIQAGVNYIDICDDDDATIALLSFDQMARKQGVTLLIGMGWTPGISNLLALYGARQMDHPAEIELTWVGSSADSEGLAVIKHVVHAVTRNVPMYENGEWRDVPALSGVAEVAFPAPIGTVSAYFCGHPEPVTLPRFISGLQRVVVRGYLLPADLQQLINTLITLGLVDREEKVDALSGLLQPLLPFLTGFSTTQAPAVSAIRVDVRGTHHGGPAQKAYCIVDKMDRLTGIPPAEAALMLVKEEIKPGAGVFAPEGCLDPEKFFARLALKNIKMQEM
ncbi:MAG: saccharopine dehydrogenase NADP-binding domain-containing protein [Bacillota bacterium]